MRREISRQIAALKGRLVDGIKVLTGEGVLTGSGHLSVRVPGTETFLIPPRFPGILAEPKDICLVDLSGRRVVGKGPIPSETPIHTTIYRSRPDVESVFHAHPRYSILLGLLDIGLVPFNREARLFADGVPIFPDSHGINSDTLAQRLVETLGPHFAVFLRGHGCVVVGPTVEGTCISAIQLERACRDQLLLMSFTEPRPMPGAGRGKVTERLKNPYRAWPFLLYKHGVKSKRQIKNLTRPLKEGDHY